MNKDPDRGWLEYESASSRWPGTLHVKNLLYRDRDPKAEWAFQLEDGEVTYSLADLLRRRFHVTRLSGHGFVFRVRNRLTRAEATPARLSRCSRSGISGRADSRAFQAEPSADRKSGPYS